MTTTHETTDTSTGPGTAPTDPRALWDRAAATATAVVDNVRPGQLGDATPCDEFDVGDLLGHLGIVVERVGKMALGHNPMEGPRSARVDDLAGFVAFWHRAVDATQDAWSDDASLEIPVKLPWFEGNGAQALTGYLSELTVHTWDLARATGQPVRWDDEVVTVALAEMRHGLPAEGRAARFAEVRKYMPPELAGQGDPFADAVPVPDDAPAVDRLVAWNGRKP